MTAESGRGFLVKIGDGGTPETFSTIAGMRATSLSINSESVEITNKDSSGWRELLARAGIRRISISGSGVFLDSTAERRLRECALAGEIVNYRIQFEAGDAFLGAFLVTSLDYSGDHNNERTYTLALESSGVPIYEPAA